jgi:NYN domain
MPGSSSPSPILWRTMLVRAYVDGFNLYYGGKALAEETAASASSWKWLDLRALVETVVRRRWTARDPVLDHVTYCTARVVGKAATIARQAAYLRALDLSGSADLIEYGLFKETYKRYPKATKDRKGRPILAGGGRPIMVGVSHREEKGSDVNLASRLLIDALTGQMEAAVVVSNDSDLALPVREARRLMPVGTISPHPGPVHGSLRPTMTPGCGHWYHSLTFDELVASQLPDPCHGIGRPRQW